MRSFLVLSLCAGVTLLLSIAGCSNNRTPSLVGGHAHPHVHGPHDGELIEIGDGEYHGEMVHDEGTVTVYVLGKAHEKAVPIKAGDIVIKMVVNSTPVEFKLPAKPEKDDPSGESSRFESKDQALSMALDNGQAERELIIPIGEKTYNAKFEHFDDEHHHHHEAPSSSPNEEAK